MLFVRWRREGEEGLGDLAWESCDPVERDWRYCTSWVDGIRAQSHISECILDRCQRTGRGPELISWAFLVAEACCKGGSQPSGRRDAVITARTDDLSVRRLCWDASRSDNSAFLGRVAAGVRVPARVEWNRLSAALKDPHHDLPTSTDNARH
jgi:hypothetical protein